MHFEPSVGAKLFTQEIFDIDDSGMTKLCVSSSVRIEVQAGVLVLEGGGAVGHTYGRIKKKNLYKCVPRDSCLPPFLIPYQIQKVGFSKRLSNLYVLFKFCSWTDDNKWPIGVLTEVLGPVSDLSVYGDYLLHSFGLFRKRSQVTLVIKSVEVSKDTPVLKKVFTIDGARTEDFDDALSWQVLEDGKLEVCVYVANVCKVAASCGADMTISPWVSTIYMPSRNRIPMLSSHIRTACSLVAGSVRECVCCRFVDGVCVDIQPSVWVRVYANFVWDDKPEIISELIRHMGLNGSRELVSFWMCRFNTEMALRGGWGFYRQGRNTGGSLVTLEERILGCGEYAWLPEGNYLPMTNPLRRMVDLLNQMILCNVGSEFVSAWAEKIDSLNLYGRHIRCVQRECSLLAVVSTLSGGQGEFDGIMFGEILGGRVSVWLPELKLFSRCSLVDGCTGSGLGRFRLFYFKEADDVRQKVRICWIRDCSS